MKKLFLYLLLIAIILCTGIVGFKLHTHSKVVKYRDTLKSYTDKESFCFSDATDFDWDRAVAFEFPATLRDIEDAAGVKIDFDYDVSQGIIFIGNGKIIFKDISAMNPEEPSDIIYELNDKHLSVYEKDSVIYVEKDDDAFYYVKKQ